jgi:hypothetical protein
MRESKLLIFNEGSDGPMAGEPKRSFNIAASPGISRIGEENIDRNSQYAPGEAPSYGETSRLPSEWRRRQDRRHPIEYDNSVLPNH